VVILAPFLTDCHETCPFTTGAFIQLSQALASRHLTEKVALVEVTVDPGRDNPARLAAYKHLTSDPATLLTGTDAALAEFWKTLGVDHEVTPNPQPYQADWFTGGPDTYDVGHTDGVFVIDGTGHERVVIVGPAVPAGRLSPSLRGLLSNPSAPAPSAAEGWTVPGALNNVLAVLHHRNGHWKS
jgi:protein SCO1/2